MLRRIIGGFIAGFIAVPVFHQGVLALLNLAGIVDWPVWQLHATAPLGVPQLISISFWGGVWGIILALLLPRLRGGGRRLVFGFLFGALLPTLVAWFVVLPLKGAPVGGGFAPAAVITALLINGAWGLGTAFLLEMTVGRSERVAA
jgi:hypothetical protein